MSTQNQTTSRHKAGLFDIRNIIGLLLFLYGLVLFIMGLVNNDAQRAKAAGINANLWVGIVLLVVGAFFIGWAYLRPIVVPDEVAPPDRDAPPPAA
ncbi:MAG: hypothetical protein ACRDPI_06315 [Nocardioidaceae bacterium]